MSRDVAIIRGVLGAAEAQDALNALERFAQERTALRGALLSVMREWWRRSGRPAHAPPDELERMARKALFGADSGS